MEVSSLLEPGIEQDMRNEGRRLHLRYNWLGGSGLLGSGAESLRRDCLNCNDRTEALAMAKVSTSRVRKLPEAPAQSWERKDAGPCPCLGPGRPAL